LRDAKLACFETQTNRIGVNYPDSWRWYLVCCLLDQHDDRVYLCRVGGGGWNSRSPRFCVRAGGLRGLSRFPLRKPRAFPHSSVGCFRVSNCRTTRVILHTFALSSRPLDRVTSVVRPRTKRCRETIEPLPGVGKAQAEKSACLSRPPALPAGAFVSWPAADAKRFQCGAWEEKSE